MICKKHILTKNDIYSHIHLMYIQLAKESIEYKVVSGKRKKTPCTMTMKNILTPTVIF
jgi:uncharacterized protein YueI